MTLELNDSRVIHRENLRGGQMWSRVIRRGQVLRLVDTQGGATPAALFYNPTVPLERYNMPDTLKGQHIARLTMGHCLYSDMGRIFFSIIADSCGWHDTITGHMTAERSAEKYGAGPYQALRNEFFRNSRDNLLIEMAKYGLGKRDLVPNVNFFVRVAADAEGRLVWHANGMKGARIDLRAEMDTLVILSNTPHPLDPSDVYAPKPIDVVVWQADPVAKDDICRISRPENERGFRLTEDYQAQARP